MARFIAEIHGNRGNVTRLGTPQSGIRSHTRGWDIGVKVLGEVDIVHDRDEFQVIITGGSHDSGPLKDLGTFHREGDTIVGGMETKIQEDYARLIRYLHRCHQGRLVPEPKEFEQWKQD